MNVGKPGVVIRDINEPFPDITSFQTDKIDSGMLKRNLIISRKIEKAMDKFCQNNSKKLKRR
jgi:hypothetical protein